jgi:hypothetical protein
MFSPERKPTNLLKSQQHESFLETMNLGQLNYRNTSIFNNHADDKSKKYL